MNRNRFKFSECFTIYNYGDEVLYEIQNSPMNASEYPNELLNSTSFDIHPMKTVDTRSIKEDNIVFFF